MTSKQPDPHLHPLPDGWRLESSPDKQYWMRRVDVLLSEIPQACRDEILKTLREHGQFMAEPLVETLAAEATTPDVSKTLRELRRALKMV